MIHQGAKRSKSRSRSLRVLLCALIVMALAGLAPAGAATPTPHLNGAGLVIKHGDGRVLYFYVQFSESQITGAQLLERSGVSLDITPYSGLGEGICLIDGEGCPSSNCFCKSFANPAVYWRYHSLNSAGTWVVRSSGPDQRIVHDGDVDGWTWSANDGDLPATSIDQIAKLNGITRDQTSSHPTPNSATIAAASPVATPTAIVAPTATIARATSTPRVLGVQVSDSGQKTPIEPVSNHATHSWRNSVWFGAGVLALLLVALVAVLRRRRWVLR